MSRFGLIVGILLLAACRQVPAAQWFSPADGRFRVLVPVVLDYRSEALGKGLSAPVRVSYRGLADGVDYAVELQPFPESPAREDATPLAAAGEALLAETGGRRIDERALPLGGRLEGMEMAARLPDRRRLICRFFRYADTLYRVRVVLPESTLPTQEAMAAQFLDSFKFSLPQ